MCSLQRIFSCSYKKANFPICLEVALGPQPWESQRALPHSSEFPAIATSPWPGRGDPDSALAEAAALALRPAAPGRPAAPRAASSCLWSCPCLEGPHLLPRPQAIHAPHRQGLRCQPHGESRIVVVCLCLLKLGRRAGLPVKTAWNVRPSAVQTALSASSGNGLEGLGLGPGLDQLAQEHTVREGRPRDCARTEVPSVSMPPCPLSVCSARP